MDDVVRSEILALARQAHNLTESSYQNNSSTRGDPAWRDKQRLLLADMALHLLQTALRDGELSQDDLKRNLYAILTVSDQLTPGYELKDVADKLYAPR
ncbi:hypothetical protein ABT364_06935 [Massilia sp. SR12]